MMPFRWYMVSSIACVAFGAPLGAQRVQPPGADTLSPRAVSESLAVLKSLDSIVRTRPKDAAAWHHLGMVAWALTSRDRYSHDVRALDYTRLGRQADTSLRIAASLAKDSTRYALALAQFLQSSGHAAARFAGGLVATGASDVGRASLDADQHASSAMAAGQVRWLRYESLAHRRMETPQGPAPRSIFLGSTPFTRLMPKLADLIREELFNEGNGRGMADPNGSSEAAMDYQFLRGQSELGPPILPLKGIIENLHALTAPFSAELGQEDFKAAEALFREAYAAAPSHAAVFRHLAMTLIEKERWSEVRALARDHVATIPWDAWGWMALGLASHRLSDETMAAAAFDSALASMSLAERARVDRVDRVLSRADSGRLNALQSDDRAAITRRFWMTQDRLWSVDHTPPRVEYLSRVAYAEIRWTIEDVGVKGADTDRGLVFIRYGPPSEIIGLAPSPGQDVTVDVTNFWWYEPSGLLFAFSGKPTYGVMRFPVSDQQYASAITDAAPVRWDNIANLRIDSLPLQIARFRARGDSVDVVIATSAPSDSIRASGTVLGDVRVNSWLLDRRDAFVARDSSVARAVNAFAFRVAQDRYLLRVEASASGAMRAASSTLRITADRDSATGFATSGFGISDILLASRADSTARDVRSWRELGLTPIVELHSRAAPLVIAWETYGITPSDGRARYEIALTVEREGSGRVFADLVGKIQGIVGIERAPDRVVFRFDRDGPALPSIAQAIPVTLASSPTGTYRVAVTITDRSNGRSSTRATSVEIIK